jgi:hypothetical protein
MVLLLRVSLGMRLFPVALVLGALSLSIAGCRSNKGTLVVANESSHLIPTASVTVCGQRFEMTDLAVGQVAEFPFQVRCEGGFKLELRRSAGQTVSEELGYITSGFDYKYRFNIKDTSIEPVAEAIECPQSSYLCS